MKRSQVEKLPQQWAIIPQQVQIIPQQWALQRQQVIMLRYQLDNILAGSTVTSSANSFNTGNTAFVIGNGEDSSNLSDAFKVMFNGDAYVDRDLVIGGNVLTIAHVAQLLNLLTQLAGEPDDQKACLKTKWNALSTC
jgi:hypothetical protein